MFTAVPAVPSNRHPSILPGNERYLLSVTLGKEGISLSVLRRLPAELSVKYRSG